MFLQISYFHNCIDIEIYIYLWYFVKGTDFDLFMHEYAYETDKKVLIVKKSVY